MKRRVALLGAALAAVAAPAHGHGLAIYVSTPFSPPDGFQWVAFVCVGALVVANVALLRRFRLAGWVGAVAGSLLAVALSGYLFFTCGDLEAGLSTGPEPGLAWGERPFLGGRWAMFGELFLTWNARGLGLLLVAIVVMCYLVQVSRKGMWELLARLAAAGLVAWLTTWFVCGLAWVWLAFVASGALFCIAVECKELLRRWRFWALLGANASVYALCLAPFLWQGVLAGGWGGGYVRQSCEMQLARIALALIEYGKEHGNRLPAGQSMDEVYPQIERYIRDNETRYDQPVSVCPMGYVYERRPPDYAWNADLSGKAMSALAEARLDFVPIVSCPYHSWLGGGPAIRAGQDLGTDEPWGLVTRYLEYKKEGWSTR
ncbi:MAG: hypothetical protein FJ290_25295 [Planctomycetes bacterium]|nr:hypothetical protein [Planctomycetota bacterium]